MFISRIINSYVKWGLVTLELPISVQNSNTVASPIPIMMLAVQHKLGRHSNLA